MKRFLLASVACLLTAPSIAGPGDSTAPLYMRPGSVTPLGFCQLAVALTAVKTSACAGGIPVGTTYALICNEGPDAVRWLDKSLVPTSTVGNILGLGTVTAPICAAFSTQLSGLSWIAETSSVTLDISFYQ